MVALEDKNQVKWASFKYMVFDIPNQHQSTYAERYHILGTACYSIVRLTCLCCIIESRFGDDRLLQRGEYIELARREVCKDARHMDIFYQDVVDSGGEGIILRDPSSPYLSGRSSGFLKHKVHNHYQDSF